MSLRENIYRVQKVAKNFFIREVLHALDFSILQWSHWMLDLMYHPPVLQSSMCSPPHPRLWLGSKQNIRLRKIHSYELSLVWQAGCVFLHNFLWVILYQGFLERRVIFKTIHIHVGSFFYKKPLYKKATLKKSEN